MPKKTYILSISLSICLLLCSCISQKLVHGNLPDAQLVSLLDVGKDSKDSTKKILGEPTFKGIFGDNSHYYVGTVNSKIAFLKPKLNNQYVLELGFDKSDKLKRIFLYDEKESINVDMSSLETMSSGKKLTFLQQIFSNIGITGAARGTIIGSGKADD
jgi:outer membrane protein assembly factor BamE (lipoprotein component of BamABCDE complex)